MGFRVPSTPNHSAVPSLSSLKTHPHGSTPQHPLLALTSGVHLGEIIEDAGAGAVGLDQVTGLQGHGPDKILPGREFLQKDPRELQSLPKRLPRAAPGPRAPTGCLTL